MTDLAKDSNYYLARLIVTRRRLEQDESGEFPVDDDTLTQLGADLEMLEVKLSEFCPPKSKTANVVRMADFLATRRRWAR